MKRVLMGLALLATVWACEDAEPQSEVMMRVNYFTQTCQGLFDGNCLLVQEGAMIGSDEWDLFYYENSIQGFEYETGYVYDLRLKVIHIENPPADGMSTELKLIEILTKTAR